MERHQRYTPFPVHVRGCCAELETKDDRRKIVEIFPRANPAYEAKFEKRDVVRRELRRQAKSISDSVKREIDSEAPWIYKIEIYNIDLVEFKGNQQTWVPADHISNYQLTYFTDLDDVKEFLEEKCKIKLEDLVRRDSLEYL